MVCDPLSQYKINTVQMHIESMSTNNPLRRHSPNAHPASGHDVFFKVGPGEFRLFIPGSDPAPLYKPDFDRMLLTTGLQQEDEEETEADEIRLPLASSQFAYEADLKNYLAQNLQSIEPGLVLYEEEGVTGIEYSVGGRRIDILAVAKDGAYVVIELKVSRGYDRVVGQLLRYMAWVHNNMDTKLPVRGYIVAKDITEDLKLAASLLPNVKLVEYEIKFSVRPVQLSQSLGL
jgi:hypothetical protein